MKWRNCSEVDCGLRSQVYYCITLVEVVSILYVGFHLGEHLSLP